MSKNEIHVTFLASKEATTSLKSEIESRADDFPVGALKVTSGIVQAQSFELLEPLSALIVALGGGVGIGAIIRSLGDAIACVRKAAPEATLRIESAGSTFDFKGASRSAIDSILRSVLERAFQRSNASEIVRALEGPSDLLIEHLYDPISARYFVPDVPRLKLPKLPWESAKAGPTAVLDTGMMGHHPWICKKIADAKDFTGEGVEDQNGHGTMVTLILLAYSEGAALLNVKVLNREGVGTEDQLVSGLEWAAQHGAADINLSLGISRNRPCSGCGVCTTASSLVERGIRIVAAVGNNPTASVCPATADGVIAIGAANPQGKAVADYSGPHPVFLAPVPRGLVALEGDHGESDE